MHSDTNVRPGATVFATDAATASNVSSELEALLSQRRTAAAEHGDHFAELWDAIAAACHGGKRMRPTLVFAAYSGFGGHDPTHVTPVAVAFELLHTAFLVHDDLIDGDEIRRGLPTVTARFATRARSRGLTADRSRSSATAAAVLAGDLLLNEAHLAMTALPVDAVLRHRLSSILGRAIFLSTAGELSDALGEGPETQPTLAKVLRTMELKTAVYSFEAPLQSGALLAGAGDEAVERLGEFGRRIGIAFQLTDDLLGMFGDPAVTGKSATADLREGKQTALIAAARCTPGWSRLANIVGKSDLTTADTDSVREHLRSSGALESTVELRRAHHAGAIEALDSPSIPQALTERLTAIASAVVTREH
jgi:geranylgeranyl diphosphate synthase type II